MYHVSICIDVVRHTHVGGRGSETNRTHAQSQTREGIGRDSLGGDESKLQRRTSQEEERCREQKREPVDWTREA